MNQTNNSGFTISMPKYANCSHILNAWKSFTTCEMGRNVKELTEVLEIKQSTISRCLVRMRLLEIVTHSREGHSIYYNLGNPMIIETYELMYQV